MRSLEIGLLGLGSVGSGVVKLLADNAEGIRARLGADVVIKKALVREADKARLVSMGPGVITTNVSDVLDDDSIKIVVELIGGEDVARDHVLAAIRRKKHVVTANKALLAVHGETIFDAAERAGVDVYYEASVAGGVPVLRALREGLASDRIDDLIGIVNGTSNYILTRMADERRPFAEILQDAQAEGYAETPPALDVEGWDSAHKLSILMSLCFGKTLALDQIVREGITAIAPVDFEMAERWGHVIRPIVLGRADETSLEARVHPAMLPRSSPLATVAGVYNAIAVSSYALGQSMYYGRGAGMMPTAVAVVADIIEVARDVLAGSPSALPLRLQHSFSPDRRVRDPGEFRCRYYLRFTAPDRFGVAAEISHALAEHGVPLAEMTQLGRADGARPVNIVARTFVAREHDVMAAVAALGRSQHASSPPALIRILD